MNVRRLDHPDDFARAATPFLQTHEAENNLLFGLLERLDPSLATLRIVMDGDRIAAAALQTDPIRNLILSRAEDGAIDALADALAADSAVLPGVLGSSPAVERFAGRWAAAHHLVAQLNMSLGIYQLTRVIPPRYVPDGLMQVATLEHLPLVVQYTREFCESVGSTIDPKLETIARRRIEGGAFHLWTVNNQPVSMAAGQGPTPHGIRIALVYTPAAFRGRGYASALVASLSQKLLDSGRTFCFLFTDLANPTSNKIYRDLGYEFVCEQRRFRFENASV